MEAGLCFCLYNISSVPAEEKTGQPSPAPPLVQLPQRLGEEAAGVGKGQNHNSGAGGRLFSLQGRSQLCKSSSQGRELDRQLLWVPAQTVLLPQPAIFQAKMSAYPTTFPHSHRCLSPSMPQAPQHTPRGPNLSPPIQCKLLLPPCGGAVRLDRHTEREEKIQC